MTLSPSPTTSAPTNPAQQVQGPSSAALLTLFHRMRDPRPMTIAEVIDVLPLPGPSPDARAQLLRRLERRGVVPSARRSLIHRDRYWMPRDVLRLYEALDAA